MQGSRKVIADSAVSQCDGNQEERTQWMSLQSRVGSEPLMYLAPYRGPQEPVRGQSVSISEHEIRRVWYHQRVTASKVHSQCSWTSETPTAQEPGGGEATVSRAITTEGHGSRSGGGVPAELDQC